MSCSDSILASCDVERAQIIQEYDLDPERVRVVPLGVEHAIFSPGNRHFARRALALGHAEELLLFVGRLQELKGVDLALDTHLELRRRGRPVHLAVVGGPSGPSGRATLAGLHARVAEAGAFDSVSFVAPQSHQILSSWYRAADVTLVPSRAESFGLVALESLACGTPVAASRVGGLTTLVHDDRNGVVLEARTPSLWADAVEGVLEPLTRARLADGALEEANRYTWAGAATTLSSIVDELRARRLLECLS